MTAQVRQVLRAKIVLAAADGLANAAFSPSQAGRILADLDLKPHRVRGRLTRRDTPDFWQRATDVCDVYLTGTPLKTA